MLLQTALAPLTAIEKMEAVTADRDWILVVPAGMEVSSEIASAITVVRKVDFISGGWRSLTPNTSLVAPPGALPFLGPEDEMAAFQGIRAMLLAGGVLVVTSPTDGVEFGVEEQFRWETILSTLVAEHVNDQAVTLKRSPGIRMALRAVAEPRGVIEELLRRNPPSHCVEGPAVLVALAAWESGDRAAACVGMGKGRIVILPCRAKFGSGDLHALREIVDVILGEEVPNPAPREEKGTLENVLREGRGYWTVRFRGKDAPPIKNLKGIHYIHVLLMNAGTPFNAHELLEQAGMSSRDRRVDVTGDAGELIDRATIRAVTQQMEELRRELDQARAREDQSEVRRLEKALEDCQKYLSEGLRPGGSIRKAVDIADRMTHAVDMAINRAFTAIEGVHPTLGRHLRKSIYRAHRAFTYDPDQPTIWGR